MLPWNAIARVELTRADIPRLPQLLADFPMAKHAALRRAAACVWPRLFWMPVPTEPPLTAGSLEWVDAALAPKDSDCGSACKSELRRLQPHDAFGTLMTNLAYRAKMRRLNALARQTATMGGTPVDEGAIGVLAATRWSRLQDEWQGSAQQLREAPWRTSAISCEVAISKEPARHR